MKKRSTLLKRRKLAIIVTAVAVVALVAALLVVLDYVNGTPFEDPADGRIYYVRHSKNEEKETVYALYDTDKKTVMPKEEQFGYYVTHAGTLVEVNAKTGECGEVILVDTEGTEELGFNQRILMFPHLQQQDILRIDVVNDEGSFAFVRVDMDGNMSPTGSFVLANAPTVKYDQELFASLRVDAGYTLTTQKIESPIKDANGEFTEYGLVSQERIRPVIDEKTGEAVIDKETGEPLTETYTHNPAFYVVTDIHGNSHKVIIGDMLVTGEGYYVQYVAIDKDGNETKRDAVYVLSSSLEKSMLVAVEDMVTPQLTYPMSMNNYFDVAEFKLYSKNESGNGYKDPVVGFSFVDMAERENTINSSIPYIFLEGFELKGYIPHYSNIDSCLKAIYSPSFAEVTKLAPTQQDMVKYGLCFETGTDEDGNPVYKMLSDSKVIFDFDVTDSSGKSTQTLRHTIYMSAPNKDGSRYAFTEIVPLKEDGTPDKKNGYDIDMIVKLEKQSVAYLEWDRYDWIESSFFNVNIAFCDKITLSSPNYSANFELDNSRSDMSESINSNNLIVHGTDSAGNDKTTFSGLAKYDKDGNLWKITATEIECYSPTGTKLTIETAYYADNAMGKQVRAVRGSIPCADGSHVYVTPDEVKIETGNGTQTILRYSTNLFRSFYETLLFASISDSYVVDAETESQIVTDENLLLTLTLVTSPDSERSEETVYKFYKLTNRKAYITVNGNGGFYVLTSRVEKFISDSQRFFADQLIDSTAKN